MDLVTREFEVRLDESDERILRGIAVPYGDVINVGGFREKFERGAISDVSDTKLFYSHAEPIGRITRGEDTADGYLIEARISKTPRGDEVLTLLKDGVLSRLSVGFQPVEHERDAQGVVVRKKVNLREVSVVAFPAYPNAEVLSVREEDAAQAPTETEVEMDLSTLETEVADLRGAITDLDRRLVVAVDSAPSNSTAQFRSFGEFVYAAAHGDETAMSFTTRDFSVIADSIVKNAWVSDVIRLVDHGRPTVSAFRKSALPADGMTIEWPQVETTTIATGTQAAEGDALTYGEINLETKTSAIKTFGGYTSLSRQVIERSSVAFLDTAFRQMAIAYSKYVNAQAIVALKALTGTGSASTVTNTAEGWFGAIADAAISINGATGLQPEFILAAPNVYKKIVTLFDENDRPIVGGVNLSNGVGSSNLPGLTANIGGLPVAVDPALSAGDCWIANSEGFVTYESGGAPFRLADQDVTHLTQDFSVYGYAAFAGPIPAAIVKVTVA